MSAGCAPKATWMERMRSQRDGPTGPIRWRRLSARGCLPCSSRYSARRAKRPNTLPASVVQGTGASVVPKLQLPRIVVASTGLPCGQRALAGHSRQMQDALHRQWSVTTESASAISVVGFQAGDAGDVHKTVQPRLPPCHDCQWLDGSAVFVAIPCLPARWAIRPNTLTVASATGSRGP